MPPLQALAALHGFWIVLLLPPVAWALRHLSAARLCLLGRGLTALGLLGLAAVVAHTLLVWLPEDPGGRRAYVGQRILFCIVVLGDVPLVQVTAAGLVCWLAGRRKQTVRDRQQDEPDAAGP